MKYVKIFAYLVILGVIALLVLPTNRVTRDYVLSPRVGKDTNRTVLLLKKDLSIDTVHVVVPRNSYLKGSGLYVPANEVSRFIPVLDAQQEYMLKDFSDVDSRVTRAMFLEEDQAARERSTE